MPLISPHTMLAAGDSLTACSQQVQDFLSRTSLVKYDRLEIVADECCPGSDPAFLRRLNNAIKKNRDSVASLLAELQQSGVRALGDLEHLEQGYPSKILHILSHFLDGFIGIDSAFYNLVDDSHWVPAPTALAIRQTPHRFWLIRINGFTSSARSASLLHT